MRHSCAAASGRSVKTLSPIIKQVCNDSFSTKRSFNNLLKITSSYYHTVKCFVFGCYKCYRKYLIYYRTVWVFVVNIFKYFHSILAIIEYKLLLYYQIFLRSLFVLSFRRFLLSFIKRVILKFFKSISSTLLHNYFYFSQ